jgi:DMSO/TMAO reductase YedYZ molybdopterin-dependent catalytic subunit
VDLHCVTKWPKFRTRWEDIPLDAFFADIETGRIRTRPLLPRPHDEPAAGRLLGGKAWIVHGYDGDELPPGHGGGPARPGPARPGPARLLVPHLHLWKSAKWVGGIRLMRQNTPGFRESAGYHDHGDPWREQRYQGDQGVFVRISWSLVRVCR